MTRTILVTGGTGFIAGAIIDQALAGGKVVHTTVRNKARNEPRLRARWPQARDRLLVVEANLENDAGWAEACAGCDGIAHVASPFPLSVPRDADELVIPAREGALRALRFARAAGAARFVLTSSAAAIAYGHGPGKARFDHTDWTVLENPAVPPYHRSKTVAEKAAREWVAANAPDMAFCSVNPVAVLGPVVNGDLSTSIELVRKLMTGAIPALPDVGFGIIDVRDVARAHLLALDAPADTVRDERLPLQARFMWLTEVAEVLRSRTPDLARKVVRRKLPDIVVTLLAPLLTELKQVKSELGRTRDVSGEHARRVLGMDYIPAEDSIAATARSLVEQGIVRI